MPATRPTRSLAVPAALAALLLGACGGGEASLGDVEDDVTDYLVERDPNPLAPNVAEDVAECVALGLFSGDEFTPDERSRALAAERNDPPRELSEKVQSLVERCEDDPSSSADPDRGSEDDDETTTTERGGGDDDETTTTVEE